MTLPTGEVTFLFSDIEGSTRHARRLGDAAWSEMLRDHDRLIDKTVSRLGGVVVKHEGDGAFAAFSEARSAVEAAIEIARELAGGSLGDGGVGVLVRIGLHTGEGRATDTGLDYVGIDVHYAARVAAAGNGGQIVISETTHSGLGANGQGALAEAIIVDAGLRKLKDFDEPRSLYRVVVPGVADDSRPLRTEDLPSNLPALPTSFVGRESEIERLADVLQTARLITLTGPGGTGKTRLAMGLAGAVRDRYRGGTWFVDLAPVRDPDLIVGTIAATLGLREEPGVPIATTVRDHLRPIDTLLILDNLEQLLPAASATVATLLAESPGLRVVVTSREVLRVRGEQEYPVPPLGEDAGVTLFLDRARSRRMDVGDGQEPDLATIRQIVGRLEGLPLAIELAAARTRLMSPTAILDRLGTSLDVLTGGARDLPERQRTLRGTVAWSHDLLDHDEQVIFRRSAVFSGGWTGDAAEAVVDPGGGLAVAVLDGLESLADKSLVRIELTEHGEARFGRHVLIREYALERLSEAGERTDCERRHAMTYLAVAEDAGPHLLGGNADRWMDLVEHEEHNLRAAMRWSIDIGEPDVGMRVAGAIWRFWQRRGRLAEGLAWTGELLAQSVETDIRARINVLAADGGMAYWNNDFPRCRRSYTERLRLAEELGQDHELAEAHYDIGFLGMIDQDMAVLRRHERLALDAFERLGDPDGAVKARQALVLGHFLTGEYAQTRELETVNLAEFQRIGATYRVHDSHMVLAAAALFEDDFAATRFHLRESARLTSGNQTDQLSGLVMAASLALRSGEVRAGARLAGATDALSGSLGVTNAAREILHLPDPRDVAHERLGDEAAALIEEGRLLTLDEALVIAWALVGIS
jgi:predicted ATPase/class 3 adenylate cyclase